MPENGSLDLNGRTTPLTWDAVLIEQRRQRSQNIFAVPNERLLFPTVTRRRASHQARHLVLSSELLVKRQCQFLGSNVDISYGWEVGGTATVSTYRCRLFKRHLHNRAFKASPYGRRAVLISPPAPPSFTVLIVFKWISQRTRTLL